jgi:hypothetical protein
MFSFLDLTLCKFRAMFSFLDLTRGRCVCALSLSPRRALHMFRASLVHSWQPLHIFRASLVHSWQPLHTRRQAISRSLVCPSLSLSPSLPSSLFLNPPHTPSVVFYIYDSYLTPPAEWFSVLGPRGKGSSGNSETVRGTKYDSVVLGLWVEVGHGSDLLRGGFDGSYTYFATDGMTYGSSHAHWPSMQELMRQNKVEGGGREGGRE